MRQHVAAERREVVEVEVLEGLDLREVRGPDPHDRAGVLRVRDLPFQDRDEVFLVRPVLLAGAIAELFTDLPDRGVFNARAR